MYMYVPCFVFTGYSCVTCTEVTPKTAIKIRDVIKPTSSLAGAPAADDTKPALCGNCKQQKPIWRCNDCKDNFCQGCRERHDGFRLFQQHRWVSFDDTLVTDVIDEILFCELHPDKTLEFHCKDCNRLTCLLCNGTAHKMHTAETVGEALARIVDDVKRKQLDVTACHKEAMSALKQARRDETQLEAEYATLDDVVDAQLQLAMEILKSNGDQVKAELKSMKQEQLAKVSGHQKTLKATVKAQQSILELTESVLKTHKNGSPLHSLQSGVRDCLETYCTLEPETLRPP